MKKITFIVLMLLSISSVQSAVIKGAKIEGDKLLIDVVHGGGCGEHLYDIDVQGCRESHPVSCDADLVHVHQDFCEALLHKTVEISLEEKGLTDSYYRNGSLTIFGEEDWMTGERSKATVILK